MDKNPLSAGVPTENCIGIGSSNLTMVPNYASTAEAYSPRIPNSASALERGRD